MERMGERIGKEAGRTSRSLSLIHEPRCPSGCYLVRDQVEAIAEQWAARTPDRSDPDWLARFIESIGGEVRPCSDPNGLLLVAERLDCFVVTGADLWTMAEALGHLVLHMAHLEPPENLPPGQPATLAVLKTLGPGGPLARARLEAVWFAGPFLMPRDRFAEAWERHDGNLRLAAAEIGMPMAMVASRSLRLGLS